MCLFEPCDEPEVLYSHSKDWLQHMRRHTQHWRCKAKSHGTKVFYGREEFDKHFEQDHNKRYGVSELNLLAQSASQSHGTLFEVCPLCGGTDEPDVLGSLTDHIIGHLRSLALKSLPPHYEDGDDASSNSDADRANGSRSTLRALLSSQEDAITVSTTADRKTRHTNDAELPRETQGSLMGISRAIALQASHDMWSEEDEEENSQARSCKSGFAIPLYLYPRLTVFQSDSTFVLPRSSYWHVETGWPNHDGACDLLHTQKRPGDILYAK